MMSLVRLLSFTTLACGCVTGKYREIATHREIVYVEEKGSGGLHHGASAQPDAGGRRFGADGRSRSRKRASWRLIRRSSDRNVSRSRANVATANVTVRLNRRRVDFPDAPRPEAGAASETPHPDSDPARHPPVLSRGLPRSAPFSYAGYCSVIVTSPPYNLGVRYRTYDDTLPRDRYLDWTGAWIKAAAEALDPAGSLFLNVGAKPTDPWTALDVAQAARPHLQLQNTIHWIKSIAIEQDAAGAGAGLTRDLNVGHYKPIDSERFINDCQEFIFHFTPGGQTPLERRAIGVKYQDASNVARWGGGANDRRCRGNTWFIPYETIQSRDKDRPHPATFPPRVPEVLRAPARRRSNEGPARSLPRARQLGACGRGPWGRFRRRGDRQALPRGSRIASQSFARCQETRTASNFALPAFSFRLIRETEMAGPPSGPAMTSLAE